MAEKEENLYRHGSFRSIRSRSNKSDENSLEGDVMRRCLLMMLLIGCLSINVLGANTPIQFMFWGPVGGEGDLWLDIVSEFNHTHPGSVSRCILRAALKTTHYHDRRAPPMSSSKRPYATSARLLPSDRTIPARLRRAPL